MKFKIIVIIILLCNVTFSWAEIKLSPIFSDGMVLQRDSEVLIWGTSNANSTIKISASWGKKSYEGKSDKDGNWKIKLNTTKAGGPYNIIIKGDKSKVELSNVLLGEVWFASGQSNMNMVLAGRYNEPVLGAMDAIMTMQNSNIRFFTVETNMKSSPQLTCNGNWKEATTSNIQGFSAVAFYYASLLNKILNVPVGIISSSVGGSKIEAWMSKESYAPFRDLKGLDTPNSSILYNGMLNPVLGYSIKGVLWYQGEANKDVPEAYPQLLKTMVDDWRAKWGVGNFPFYYVQIAPYNYNKGNKEGVLSSAYMREAQLKSLSVVPNTGMAVLSDIGDEKTIHPREKRIVGNRLAYLALANTYGEKGFQSSGPLYKSMKVSDNKITVEFSPSSNGLSTYGKELTGFEIAGEDRVFIKANARIKNQSEIEVYSDKVAVPVAVRYGFKDYFEGVLYNLFGLPASSFRTDNWEIEK